MAEEPIYFPLVFVQELLNNTGILISISVTSLEKNIAKIILYKQHIIFLKYHNIYIMIQNLINTSLKLLHNFQNKPDS